jgi:DNA-3-methyladenine glycosylase I
LIVHEFLMSLGYLPGAHEPDCPVYKRVLVLAPQIDVSVDAALGC